MRSIHPLRNITLRAAAILQGFPAGYNFLPLTNSVHAIARMIGNVFPPSIPASSEVSSWHRQDHYQTKSKPSTRKRKAEGERRGGGGEGRGFPSPTGCAQCNVTPEAMNDDHALPLFSSANKEREDGAKAQAEIEAIRVKAQEELQAA